VTVAQNTGGETITNILFRDISYQGKLSLTGANFEVTIHAESRSTNEISAQLFEGDGALLSP
jgi:hypothetical protein